MISNCRSCSSDTWKSHLDTEAAPGSAAGLDIHLILNSLGGECASAVKEASLQRAFDTSTRDEPLGDQMEGFLRDLCLQRGRFVVCMLRHIVRPFTSTAAEGDEGGRRGRMPASLKAGWSGGAGWTGGWQDCADGRALVQSMPIRGSHKSWALWAGLCQQSTEWIDFKRHWKKKECKRGRARKRRESDYLIHPPPEAHTPFHPASHFRTGKGGGRGRREV